MSKIKLVSWDVYGTIIATGYDDVRDNCDSNPVIARPGALEALTKIKSKSIFQCTCSDGHLGNLKDNFREIGINDWREFFEDLYLMDPGVPKDFSYMFRDFQIKPSELLVIGDNYDIDLAYAKIQGCKIFHVPENLKLIENPLDVDKIMKLVNKK